MWVAYSAVAAKPEPAASDQPVATVAAAVQKQAGSLTAPPVAIGSEKISYATIGSGRRLRAGAEAAADSAAYLLRFVRQRAAGFLAASGCKQHADAHAHAHAEQCPHGAVPAAGAAAAETVESAFVGVVGALAQVVETVGKTFAHGVQHVEPSAQQYLKKIVPSVSSHEFVLLLTKVSKLSFDARAGLVFGRESLMRFQIRGAVLVLQNSCSATTRLVVVTPSRSGLGESISWVGESSKYKILKSLLSRSMKTSR